MKYFNYLLISLFLIVFFSCSDEENFNTKTEEPSNLKFDGTQTVRLQFNSIEDMEYAEQQGFYSSLGRNLKSGNQANFVSLMSPVKEETLRAAAGFEEGESEDYYYYALGYDSLIPNKNWAGLFNKDGELQVNNEIIKITTNGTYIYQTDKENKLKTLLTANPNLLGINKIQDRKYAIEEGILFYDTYGKIEPLEKLPDFEFEEENEDADMRSSLKAYDSYGKWSTLKEKFDGILREIGYGDFPIYSSGRKTWAGKLIQGITKNRATRTVNFDGKKRRVKGKFYGYDWGLKQEAGVEGWTDAKRGLGNWTKTPADELVLGWQGVTFSVTIPKHLREIQTIKEFRESIQIKTKDPFMQPFTTKVYSFHSLKPNSFATEQEAKKLILNSLEKGKGLLKDNLKKAVDILNQKGANQSGITKESIDNAFSKREGLVIFLEDKIVVHIPYDFMRRKKTKHESAKFYSRSIEDVTINFSNNTIPNIINGIKKIKGSINSIDNPIDIVENGSGYIKTGQGIISLYNLANNIITFNRNAPSYELSENDGDAFIAAKFGNTWKGFRITYSNEAMHRIKNEIKR